MGRRLIICQGPLFARWRPESLHWPSIVAGSLEATSRRLARRDTQIAQNIQTAAAGSDGIDVSRHLVELLGHSGCSDGYKASTSTGQRELN